MSRWRWVAAGRQRHLCSDSTETASSSCVLSLVHFPQTLTCEFRQPPYAALAFLVIVPQTERRLSSKVSICIRYIDRYLQQKQQVLFLAPAHAVLISQFAFQPGASRLANVVSRAAITEANENLSFKIHKLHKSLKTALQLKFYHLTNPCHQFTSFNCVHLHIYFQTHVILHWVPNNTVSPRKLLQLKMFWS